MTFPLHVIHEPISKSFFEQTDKIHIVVQKQQWKHKNNR